MEFNFLRLPNADDESRNSNHNRPVKPLSILEIRRRERAKQLEVSGNVANRAITTNSGDGAADQLRLRPKAWKRLVNCIYYWLILQSITMHCNESNLYFGIGISIVALCSSIGDSHWWSVVTEEFESTIRCNVRAAALPDHSNCECTLVCRYCECIVQQPTNR